MFTPLFQRNILSIEKVEMSYESIKYHSPVHSISGLFYQRVKNDIRAG
ncbi:Uncharacterized protein {ECO:0000313/EMBL:ERM12547.1} [Pantoea ananatis]|nr:Uncharacterized protein {ECO:0000313/EMBL:ERM12547.1} [Pantoea ananatis]